MNKRPVIVAINAVVLALYYFSSYSNTAIAQVQSDQHPIWAKEGNHFLPGGYREWANLESPSALNALKDTDVKFSVYYNIYMHFAAFEIYKKTNEFPEGTIHLNERQLTKRAEKEDGSRTEIAGRRSFPAAFIGIDIAFKDSKRIAEVEIGDTSISAITHRPTLRPQKLHQLKRVLPVI